MREWGMGGPTDSQVVCLSAIAWTTLPAGTCPCKTCLIRTPFNTKIQNRKEIDLVVDSPLSGQTMSASSNSQQSGEGEGD